MGRARSAVVGLCVGFVAGILIAHALAVIGMQLRGRPIVAVDPFLGALVGAAIGFLYAPHRKRPAQGREIGETSIPTGPTRESPGSLGPRDSGGQRTKGGLSAMGSRLPASRTRSGPRTAPTWSRATFAVLTGSFAVCIVVQILLAGMAVFADPRHWAQHVRFVHVFELLPLAMALVAWAGGLPTRLAWQSAGLFGLIFLMYFTANVRAVAPTVAALHPVMAMVLALAAAHVTRQASALLAPRDAGRNTPRGVA